MTPRRDDWIDDDEYPDDRDIEQFGEYSPPDYDPLTIGRAHNIRTSFWTRTRIVIAVIVLILLVSFAAAEILPLLSR
jgi:hypothetical protein